MSETRLELVRGLGPWASAAIVVGTMIGTGIFLKPAEMAREGRFVSMVFAAWIVGALLSIFGALSYAELGQLGADITCAIKSNMPNAVVAINQSTWNAAPSPQRCRLRRPQSRQ